MSEMTELAERLPSPERMKSVIAAHISDHPDVVEYGEYTGTLPQDERPDAALRYRSRRSHQAAGP